MRVWLLLILIALVPLRTWAGDVMAIQMAPHANTAVAVASHTHKSAQTNCHELQTEPEAGATNSAQGHCATCASCQACFTVAIATPSLQIAAQTLPHHQPVAANAQFTSAILALGHKPPIS
jgi:hypothetical protein